MNRYATMRVSWWVFFSLLTPGKHSYDYNVSKDGLPADSELVNVRHVYPNEIDLLIRSDTFAEVKEGETIPEINPLLDGLSRSPSAPVSEA